MAGYSGTPLPKKLGIKPGHRVADRLDPVGGSWVAWPKQASGVATDVNGDVVREALLTSGLVDNKVCAIDETWSGLRGVVRVKDRPGWRVGP